MARITSVEITYGERTVKGLDKYEHRDASATATVAIEDNDDPTAELEKVGDEVRGRVRNMLGLTSKAELSPEAVKAVRERTGEGMEKCKRALKDASGDVEEAVRNLCSSPGPPHDAGKPADNPTPPHPAEKSADERHRSQIPPAQPAKSDMKPTDEQGRPVASTNEKKARGQNADNLVAHLKAVYDAGNPVPDQQIERLPQSKQKEVRQYMDSQVPPADGDPGEQDDDQEPAGSHDDPPVNEAADATGGVLGDEPKSGPDQDATESDDPGENAEADEDEPSAVSDDDLRRIIAQAQRVMSKEDIMGLLKVYNVNRFTDVTGKARTELYNNFVSKVNG